MKVNGAIMLVSCMAAAAWISRSLSAWERFPGMKEHVERNTTKNGRPSSKDRRFRSTPAAFAQL